MLISFKDKDGKKVHTHSTLLDEQKSDAVKDLHKKSEYFTNGATFVSFFLSMEAVNRIRQLKGLRLEFRAGIVALPVLLTRFLAPSAYWYLSGDARLKKLCDGAPIWEDKFEVPELDKMFFFLDDENGYEPSLWHHGITSINKPKRFYNHYQV
eukprot:TRINITY_DN0_c1276_g1_i2.p1 TRINITY_DN0_c1276_g1~~TRINITY_DN0_c1276_g1_i2.p1  ORF type:complete len:153 (+),score=38.84 TRINITY_DN0_c1276_g1_i2:62-520(+)